MLFLNRGARHSRNANSITTYKTRNLCGFVGMNDFSTVDQDISKTNCHLAMPLAQGEECKTSLSWKFLAGTHTRGKSVIFSLTDMNTLAISLLQAPATTSISLNSTKYVTLSAKCDAYDYLTNFVHRFRGIPFFCLVTPLDP